MFRPDVVEAYARRLVDVLSSDLGTHVASVQRTLFESEDSRIVEWKAMLDTGVEIRLSAAILGSSVVESDERPPKSLVGLRELGICPEGFETPS